MKADSQEGFCSNRSSSLRTKDALITAEVNTATNKNA